MSAYRFVHNFDLIIVTEARAFKLNPNDLKIKKKNTDAVSLVVLDFKIM